MLLLPMTPLFLSGVAVSGFLVIITFLTWRYHKTVTGLLAVAIMVCASVYCLLFTLSIWTSHPLLGSLLVALQLPSRIFLPVLFFLFILVYCGEIDRITLKVFAWTCTFPFIMLFFAISNPYHSLFITIGSARVMEGMMVYSFTPGPGFWMNSLYSYTLMIAGLALAISRFFRLHQIYRLQITAILVAFVIPFFIHFILILTPGSPGTVFFFFVAFALSAIAVYIATSRFQLLSLTPVALPVLFDKMTDGVLIIDPTDRIVESNPAAARICGSDRSQIIGHPVGERGIVSPGITFQDLVHMQGPVEVTIPLEGHPRYYDVRSIPLCGEGPVLRGTILLIHDSHERHLTEINLKKANEKLHLLTSLTRHDILNTLTALKGYLDLATWGPLPEETLSALQKAALQADLLKDQVEFTRDYQALGFHSAVWQNAGEVIAHALPLSVPPSIDLEPILFTIRVYADPMLGRVFFNLVENSIRHGGSLTKIKISADEAGADLYLVYEDDGEGVPVSEKDKIFEKGFGKNTGFGLFLAREILALTGITIRETGIPGKGVRFEITVPGGAYRWDLPGGAPSLGHTDIRP